MLVGGSQFVGEFFDDRVEGGDLNGLFLDLFLEGKLGIGGLD